MLIMEENILRVDLAIYHLKVYRPAIWTQLSWVYKLFNNKILRSYKQDKYDDIIWDFLNFLPPSNTFKFQ